MRVTGGRTVVWGRQSYRFSQQDLKGASFDGFGMDWPLDYKDLVPYYELVEDYVGISGMAENVPELPDSKFLPPMALTCAEQHVRDAVKAKFDRTLTIGRVANLTKPINGRAPCHYCGPCERGCITHSYFNSAFTTVADALKTGRCTHIPNAMVYQVLMDPGTNKARGVVYVDRVTRQVREVRAKVVVLCAQALESARILFNSATNGPRRRPRQLERRARPVPDGSHVGRRRRERRIPRPRRKAGHQRPEAPERPLRHPLPQHDRTGRGTRTSSAATASRAAAVIDFNMDAAGFGQAYKDAVKSGIVDAQLRRLRRVPALQGESRPHRQERDRHLRHPGAAREHGVGREREEDDPRHGRHRRRDARSGRREERAVRTPSRIACPGYGIHEMGVARMGADPKTSVLNQFQQTHDIKNLFVMDAAGFASGATQNPTLTIMALAVRSSDYLMQELKKGNL